MSPRHAEFKKKCIVEILEESLLKKVEKNKLWEIETTQLLLTQIMCIKTPTKLSKLVEMKKYILWSFFMLFISDKSTQENFIRSKTET
jgi:hypothetical protein